MQNEVNLDEYTFYRVASCSEVPNGERIFFDIGNNPIVLLNLGNQFFAIGDICTHDDGPLGDGEVEGYEIICPRHGAHFDLRNGHAVRGPAIVATPWYPVRIVDDFLEVGIQKEK